VCAALAVRRHDEDAHRLRHFGPHLRRTLHVDIQQQIVTLGARLVSDLRAVP